MSEESFQLLGHDNPWGKYPAPVVPVGRNEKGSLTVVYAETQSHQIVVSVDDKAQFVKHDSNTAMPPGFDHLRHRLFAFDKENLCYYAIEHEQKFFKRLLRDSRLKGGNPFLRLSFAKETSKKSLIIREIVACLGNLSKPKDGKPPVFVDYWYENERQTFAKDQRYGFDLPERWQDLVARESAPIPLKILSKLTVPGIIIPAVAIIGLIITGAFLLSIRATLLATSLAQMLTSMNSPVLVVLVILSVMLVYSAAIVVERLLAYRAVRRESAAFLERLRILLKNKDFFEAFKMSSEYPKSHLAVIVKSAFAELKSSGFSEVSNDEIEAARHAALRARRLKAAELKRGLSALATVSSLAPIIGLLGTVLAIINSFRALTLGQAGIEIIAGVISEALITTGVGLLVAVPAFLLYKYFERTVAIFVSDMDNAIKEIEARFGQNQRANYGKQRLALE